MAKIKIMMMFDLSIGSTIKHKLCAELLNVKEKHKKNIVKWEQ